MLYQDFTVRTATFDGTKPVIPGVYGDTGRYLRAFFADLTIPDGATAFVQIHRPNETYWTIEAEISGQYVIAEADQIMTQVGDVDCTLVVEKDGVRVSSFPFIDRVQTSNGGEPQTEEQALSLAGLQEEIDALEGRFPIQTADIAADAVQNENILDGSVTTEKLNENTVAPAALRLVAPATVTDTFNFRQTGNGLPGIFPKQSKLKKLVGASMAWNQLVANGNFAYNTGWSGAGGVSTSIANNKLTATGTSNVSGNARITKSVSMQKDHIVFSSATITPTSGKTNICSFFYENGSTLDVSISTKSTMSRIAKLSNNSSDFRIYINRGNVMVEGDTCIIENVYILDLTLVFGSTIANYAYTLESGTAGAGVAWLKSQGFFTEDYYAYDAGSLQSVETDKAISTNADSTESHAYSLGHQTLRGLYKLDANNNIVADGDEWQSETITRNFSIKNLGDLSWTRVTSGTYPYFESSVISGAKVQSGLQPIVCTKFSAASPNSGVYYSSESHEKMIGFNPSTSSSYVRVQDSDYSDAATFKTAMDGVYLIYLLKTPTTESVTAFPSTMFAESGGTEQLTDYAVEQGTRDVELPIGTEIEYEQAVIDGVPYPPSTNGTYSLKVTVNNGVNTFSWA